MCVYRCQFGEYAFFVFREKTTLYFEKYLRIHILMKTKNINLNFCINDDYSVLNMHALCQAFSFRLIETLAHLPLRQI